MAHTPEGYHTVTPQLIVHDGNAALAHYEKALGATVLMKMPFPGTDKLMHSCMQVGTSKVFVADENPQMKSPKNGGGAAQFYVYVDDVDTAHRTAIAAGMAETMPPTDMFWGDRMSGLIDPFGHMWQLATHTRDLSPAEMEKGMTEWAKMMPAG